MTSDLKSFLLRGLAPLFIDNWGKCAKLYKSKYSQQELTGMELGKSNCLPTAITFAKLHAREILATPQCLPIVYKKIDWKPKRGAGKRVRGMVKGGMCTLMGKETYRGVDFSAYDELKEQLKVTKMDCMKIEKYVHARLFGCNHLESMAVAFFRL